MPKSAITDLSTTAASNTDIDGVDIQGTAAASNIDDALREFGEMLADTNAGTSPWADTMCIADAADLTKKFRFEASGITAGQTRVLTVPDSNGTLLTTGNSATLGTIEALTLGAGDMLYATAADTLTDLAIGTAGQFLVTNAGATAPEWASRATLVSLEGLTLGAGDTLYATGADTLADLAIGTAGQVYRVNTGATAPEWGSSVSIATAQASTSGTSIDFNSIPSWVKRITVMFAGVSTNGTSALLIQIGGSGGVESSAYLGAAGVVGGSEANYTTGFGLDANHSAGAVLHGQVILSQLSASANTWVASSVMGKSDASNTAVGGGSKSLSATLDRVRITTVNGTDAFDAGLINILYE